MAKTTKLAGTFKAARVEVQASPDKIGAAFDRCRELGLLPEERHTFDRSQSTVCFKVVVPLSFDPLPPHIPNEFVKAMEECGAKIDQDGTRNVELTCPKTGASDWKLVAQFDVPAIGAFAFSDQLKVICNIGFDLGNFFEVHQKDNHSGLPALTLCAYTLEDFQHKSDISAAYEFGQGLCEIWPPYVFNLVAVQKHGGPGVLNVKGRQNCFFVPDYPCIRKMAFLWSADKQNWRLDYEDLKATDTAIYAGDLVFVPNKISGT